MNENLRSSRLAELNILSAPLRAELHRYASRPVGSRFDGEDVVQDVMERAMLAIEELSPDVPLRPWLFRITHNRAIGLLRMRSTQTALDKATLVGREKVGTTFLGMYGHTTDWAFLAPAIADGVEVLAVFEQGDSPLLAYVMRVEWKNGRIASIHDYRYTRYIMREMHVAVLPVP